MDMAAFAIISMYGLVLDANITVFDLATIKKLGMVCSLELATIL